MGLNFVPLSEHQVILIAQNPLLRSYLVKLPLGRKATPHSGLYEGIETSITVSKGVSIMKLANAVSPFGELFNQFDLEKLLKCGPQGEVPPLQSPEARETLEPLFKRSPYDNEMALQEYFPLAENFARFLFGNKFSRLSPRPLGKVIDYMDFRDTLESKSGFPRNAVRKSVIREEIADAESGKAWDYPAVLLFRQYRGKLRPVGMYPMSLNLLEFQFTQVIQETIRSSDNPIIRAGVSPGDGFDSVKRTITKQYRTSKIIGGDTTKMDAHMRKAQIRLVFEICKGGFHPKYWDALYRVLMQITTIELLCGVTSKLLGPHGLASGSGGTQLTETILVMFIAGIHRIQGQGIGDDFILLSEMSANELVSLLGEFGLPANPEKQTVEENGTTFLQRLFHRSFLSRDDNKVLGAYYSTIGALITMLQPERFWSPKLGNSDMFCTRIFMILENTIDAPCFGEFAKFVVKGHRDLKPFAKKSAKDLDAIQVQARRLHGLNPTYNQEKMDKPLSSFTSIQFVKNL